MQNQGYEYARSLIEASLDPMIVINTEGIITDLNEALVNVTHKSREQLKGTPFDSYFTNPEKAREVYKNVLDHGFIINYPLTFIDGVLTDILFNGSTYKDENGNVLGAVVFARDINEKKRIEKTLDLDNNGNYKGALTMLSDITKRKTAENNLRKSEAKLKEAQTLAHISNWEIDLKTNANFWSDEFYNIFGLTQEEIKPSLEIFISLIHPDDYALAKKSIEKSFETFEEGAFEAKVQKKDGTIRQVFTKWKFEFDLNNKPTRLFGTLQDVTDRKNTEAEHKKMVNEIIQRSKNLEQFTYIISHNLRAPISNILGLSSILRGNITETERKKSTNICLVPLIN